MMRPSLWLTHARPVLSVLRLPLAYALIALTLAACEHVLTISETERAAQIDALVSAEVCHNFPHYRASHADTPDTQNIFADHNKVRRDVYHCPDEVKP